MTKTFKKCTIFLIASVWLLLMRVIFSIIPLSSNVSDWIFSFFNQVIGLGLIPIVLYKFWVKGNVFVDFRIKKVKPIYFLYAFIIGILLYIATTGISVVWQMAIRLLGFIPINGVGVIYSSPLVLVMDIIVSAVLPGIFEELTDRGLALSVVENVKDERMKIIIVALLFGLAHQNIQQLGYAYVGGLVFAYLALKIDSILPGMIIHFTNNFLSVLTSYGMQKNNFIGFLSNLYYTFVNKFFLLAIALWIGAVVGIICLLKYITKDAKLTSESREKADDFVPFSDEDIQSVYKSTKLSLQDKTKWYDYACLYGSIAITCVTTMMTFLWGLWR